MKTILHTCSISFLFVLLPLQIIAQQVIDSGNPRTAFRKGTEQITITYGYSRGSLVNNRSVTQIQAGYYVANRIMIGLAGSLMKEWLGELSSKNMFSGGPLIKYQFTASRLSPFATLAYQFGKPTINPTVNQALLFTPGVNFALFPAVRLEASYSLLFVPTKERISQPQIGATILFGNKQ
ncbi:hypothetical protein GCM10027592_26390 [Spirosoma flavus]